MRSLLALIGLSMGAAGCAGSGVQSLQACTQPAGAPPEYVIGAGDSLDVFVWRNPDLSATIPVRPDGRMSMPLVQDMTAIGKTPAQLAQEIEVVLGEFIRDPTVNVIVRSTGGASQIQVVGSVRTPQSLPYREGMKVLDAVVAAGGLVEFAAGNRATLVRTVDQATLECRVRLRSLINEGELSQNVELRPGDVVIVPESSF